MEAGKRHMPTTTSYLLVFVHLEIYVVTWKFPLTKRPRIFVIVPQTVFCLPQVLTLWCGSLLLISFCTWKTILCALE